MNLSAPLRVDRLNVAAGITVFHQMSQIKHFHIMVFHNIRCADAGSYGDEDTDRVGLYTPWNEPRTAKRSPYKHAREAQRLNKLRDSVALAYGHSR